MQFSENELQALIQKAIMDAMSPENKNALITEAIKSLMIGDDSYYGRGLSKLQKIFSDQAEIIARKIITEALLESQDFKESIKDLFVKAATSYFVDQSKESLTDNFCAAFEKGLHKLFKKELEENED